MFNVSQTLCSFRCVYVLSKINSFDEYVIKIIRIWVNKKNSISKFKIPLFMYLIYLGVFPFNIICVLVSTVTLTYAGSLLSTVTLMYAGSLLSTVTLTYAGSLLSTVTLMYAGSPLKYCNIDRFWFSTKYSVIDVCWFSTKYCSIDICWFSNKVLYH